jgi:hypothetical protein
VVPPGACARFRVVVTGSGRGEAIDRSIDGGSDAMLREETDGRSCVLAYLAVSRCPTNERTPKQLSAAARPPATERLRAVSCTLRIRGQNQPSSGTGGMRMRVPPVPVNTGDRYDSPHRSRLFSPFVLARTTINQHPGISPMYVTSSDPTANRTGPTTAPPLRSRPGVGGGV